MHAVLIEVDVSGVGRQVGIQGLRDQIVPAISQLPGFQSGTWLTGNERGHGLSLTLWDTEANAQVMAERFGIGSSPQMSAMISRCEVREVAATACLDLGYRRGDLPRSSAERVGAPPGDCPV